MLRGSLSLFEPLKDEGGEEATEAEQEAQQRVFVRFERSHLHNECIGEAASVGTETGASHPEAPR